MEYKKDAKILFESLRLLKKGSDISEYNHRMFIDNLKRDTNSKYSLMAIFEILRIKESSLLSSKEKDLVLTALMKCLKTENIDLTTFFSEKIAHSFDLEKHTKKIIGLVKTVASGNIKALQSLLAVLLEQSANPEHIIKVVISQVVKDKSYNDVFLKTKLSCGNFVEEIMSHMEDKDYIDVFCSLQTVSVHNLRNIGETKTKKSVKSSDKLRYVESAIEKGFINEIVLFYYNDKDKRIRQLLAKSKFAFSKNIISRFLNDNDALVRENIISTLDVEECIGQDVEVYDRLLDIEETVRKKTFILYDRLYSYIKTYCFSSFIPINEEFKENTQNVKRRRLVPQEDQKNTENYFTKFSLNLFKGLLTAQKSEYEKVLDQYEFSFDFYHSFLDQPGVESYFRSVGQKVLEKIDVNSLENIQKRTYFMVFDGILNEKQIKSLIEEDIESAIYYMRDKNIVPFMMPFISSILKEITELPLSLTITILERLEDYKDICPAENITNPLVCSFLKRDFTLANFDVTNFDVTKFDSSFYKAFFMCKTNPTEALDVLRTIELSDHEVYEILIASKKLDILSLYCDRILENEEDFCKIHQKRNILKERILGISFEEFFKGGVHNIYLYFLMTGRIAVCDTDFFISLVHFISRSVTNKNKISKLLKNYLGSIPKETYYEFASICYCLKTKSMYSTGDQEYNKIQDMDEMLYYIISLVLNFNVYKISEKNYNLEMFYDVIEENVQLVLSKH
ncbi:hypothetical protein NGRA_1243 [Nosema granulosis]|uniref:Uncharacterized protein n=1 Tax=Nosema granulosis TaxID=83296 RepID=A0A9P6GYT2_9MICR|nr:hypothetical protein NGRA_1243 [Nosema granulosis]